MAPRAISQAANLLAFLGHILTYPWKMMPWSKLGCHPVTFCQWYSASSPIHNHHNYHRHDKLKGWAWVRICPQKNNTDFKIWWFFLVFLGLWMFIDVYNTAFYTWLTICWYRSSVHPAPARPCFWQAWAFRLAIGCHRMPSVPKNAVSCAMKKIPC